MFKFEHSVIINRPVKEIFDFVTEVTNHPKFSPSETAEWASQDAPKLGSIFRSVSRFLGRSIESTGEITSWNPPHKYSYSGNSGPITLFNQWEFEEIDGGTQVTLSGEVEAGGFFNVAEGLLAKQVDKQIPTDLSALKLLLEEELV